MTAATRHGIGASVPRKEDDRFLRGQGQYVADFRMPGTREVAFVQQPGGACASATRRWCRTNSATPCFTAERPGRRQADLVAIRRLRGFKHSTEPILATDKLRFVGEIVAMCVAPTRAEAEDIASQVTVDYDELPAVTDMLAAQRAGRAARARELERQCLHRRSPRTGSVEQIAATADIKVTRDDPHSAPLHAADGRARCAGLSRSPPAPAHRSSPPRSFRTRCRPACANASASTTATSASSRPTSAAASATRACSAARRSRCLARAARSIIPCAGSRICREHLTANANCREHHYRDHRICRPRRASSSAIDCVGAVDAGAYSVYPISSALEAAQIANLLPGPYVFSAYRCRAAAVATNKCPILPYRGVARTGICLAIEVIMDAIAREAGLEPLRAAPAQHGPAGADAVRQRRRQALRQRRSSRSVCGGRSRRSGCRRCARASSAAKPTAG